MNKVIIKILIVISIFIIAFGIVAADKVKNEIKGQNKLTENIYIDGSDATAIVNGFEEIGTALLGVAMIFYSFAVVACIWGIYGIILLIVVIVKKYKFKKDGKIKELSDIKKCITN